MDDSPVLLVQRARANLKHTLSEAAEAEQEPSLAAARAAAAALAAACRALAAEALLASLTLTLAEISAQVCRCTIYVLLQLLQVWLCFTLTPPAGHYRTHSTHLASHCKREATSVICVAGTGACIT